jgi:hypothetical protein
VVKLYVEGGGDYKDLQIECWRGFCEFLEKAGLKGKMLINPALKYPVLRKRLMDV